MPHSPLGRAQPSLELWPGQVDADPARPATAGILPCPHAPLRPVAHDRGAATPLLRLGAPPRSVAVHCSGGHALWKPARREPLLREVRVARPTLRAVPASVRVSVRIEVRVARPTLRAVPAMLVLVLEL